MLELVNVTVAYGAIVALQGVSLKVERGTLVAILGANGAGKSTLLRTSSGLVRPRAGSLMLDGQDLVKESPERIVAKGIVHVPEGRGIFPDLTVRENLVVGAHTRHGAAAIRTDYDEIMTMFPALARRERQEGSMLSGGEQQMLAIGRALMARPKILLADEVSLGLAPVITRQLFAQLLKLRARGITLVVVEQNANLVLKAADYVYVLKHGRIVLSGTPGQLATDRELTEAYLGV
jgi:branched-chain amino acid transport system ATP-binding protein